MKRIKLFESFEDVEHYKKVSVSVAITKHGDMIDISISEIELFSKILGESYDIELEEYRNLNFISCTCDKNTIDIYKIRDDYYLIGLLVKNGNLIGQYEYYICDQKDGVIFFINKNLL